MKNYKLLETIADIAYQAGQLKYFSGDSRADMSEFVHWATQFEKQNVRTDWSIRDYILEIEEFTSKKIADAIQNFR